MNQAIVPVKNLTLHVEHDESIQMERNTDITLQSGDTLTFIVTFEVPSVFTDGAKITVKKEIVITVV